MSLPAACLSPELGACDAGAEEFTFVLSLRAPPPSSPEPRGNGDAAELRLLLYRHPERAAAEVHAAGVAPSVDHNFHELAVVAYPQRGGLGVLPELPCCRRRVKSNPVSELKRRKGVNFRPLLRAGNPGGSD